MESADASEGAAEGLSLNYEEPQNTIATEEMEKSLQINAVIEVADNDNNTAVAFEENQSKHYR